MCLLNIKQPAISSVSSWLPGEHQGMSHQLQLTLVSDALENKEYTLFLLHRDIELLPSNNIPFLKEKPCE